MPSEPTLPPPLGAQQQLLQSLVASLQDDEDVLALAMRDSLLRPQQVNRWSDVDVALVVRDGALDRFFPALDWLASLGPIFGYEQFAQEDRYTARVCFHDFRRLDAALAAETKFLEADRRSQPLFPGPSALLISRSPAAARALSQEDARTTAPDMTPLSWQRKSNAFWFKAVIAVTKVVRDDLLVALHLALDLLQECCVLGMMLRDRATETTHHRAGGTGNDVVSLLPVIEPPYTPFTYPRRHREKRRPLRPAGAAVDRDVHGKVSSFCPLR